MARKSYGILVATLNVSLNALNICSTTSKFSSCLFDCVNTSSSRVKRVTEKVDIIG